MAEGFRVDLAALEQAAAGVDGTLEQVRRRKVSDLAGDQAAYGHDRLGETVADFCSRWQLGVDYLSADGGEVATRLRDSARAYERVEQGVHDHLNRILQSATGPDPAAR